MTTWTVRARGAAGADEAWDRYADTRRWSQWSPQIRSVRTSGGQRIVTGLIGEVRPIVGPAVHFRIDEVDEAARTWAWTARLGPITLRLWHGVTADGVDGSGSATWLRVQGPLPVLLAYLPVARFALGRLVAL